MLRITASSALLTYLFCTVDLHKLGSALKQVDLLWFLAVLATALLVRGILALRWVVLLHARGTRLPWWRAFQINLIGSFFNTFLPSTIGGDIVRAHRLSALKGKTADSVISVIMGRTLGLLALAIVAAAGCVIYYDLIRDTGAITAVAIIWFLLGGAAFIFYTADTWQALLRRFVKPKQDGRLKALTTKLNALHNSAAGFRSSPGTLILGLVLSLSAKTIAASATGLALAKAIGINIPVGYLIVFSPIRQCLMMLPISIQGIGLRETSAVFFYHTRANIMTEAQAIALGLLGYGLLLSMSVIGGVVYACSGSFKRQGTGRQVRP